MHCRQTHTYRERGARSCTATMYPDGLLLVDSVRLISWLESCHVSGMSGKKSTWTLVLGPHHQWHHTKRRAVTKASSVTLCWGVCRRGRVDMAHDRELAFLISANVIDFPESCEIAQPRRVAANLPSISAALPTKAAAGALHPVPSCPGQWQHP